MSGSGLSRRKVMAAGAAAVAGATTIGRAATVGADGASLNGEAVSSTAQSSMRLEAFPSVATGEQCYLVPGIAMTGNPLPIYVGNPYAGVHGTYVGMAVTAPLGALITAVDFCVYGNPAIGSLAIQKYLPDSTGYDTTPASQVLSGTGAQVFTLALGQTFDGTQAYHAFYSGATATSVLRAIRVRYIPAQKGFVAINPVRVYDSRLSMVPDANGALANNANRTVTVVNGRDVTTGVVNAPNVVPASATAIAYTLTVANTVGSGYIAVNPGGNDVVSASTINWWQPGSVLANTSVVKLGANGTVTAIAGGGSTDFIIDIVGYFTS